MFLLFVSGNVKSTNVPSKEGEGAELLATGIEPVFTGTKLHILNISRLTLPLEQRRTFKIDPRNSLVFESSVVSADARPRLF